MSGFTLRCLRLQEPIELPEQLKAPELLLEHFGPIRGVTDPEKLILCCQLEGRKGMSMFVSGSWCPPLEKGRVYMPMTEMDEIMRMEKAANTDKRPVPHVKLGFCPQSARSALLLSGAIYSTTPVSDLDDLLREHDLSDVEVSSAGKVKYLVARTVDSLYCNGEKVPVPKRMFVAIRGTVTKADLRSDLDAKQYGDYGGFLHSGFSSAANSVPVMTLATLARKEDRELIFCGHSMGGAIAHLLTLRLLTESQGLDPNFKFHSIAFGSPHVASVGVAKYVRKQQWYKHFVTFVADGDCVPSLLNLSTQLSHMGSFTELSELVEQALPLLQMVIPTPGAVQVSMKLAAQQLQPYWKAGLEYAQGVGVTTEMLGRMANNALKEPYAPFGIYHFMRKSDQLQSFNEQTSYAAVNDLLSVRMDENGVDAHRMSNYRTSVRGLTTAYGWQQYSEQTTGGNDEFGFHAKGRRVTKSDTLQPTLTEITVCQSEATSLRLTLQGTNLSFVCPEATIFQDVPVERTPDNHPVVVLENGLLRNSIVTLRVQLSDGKPLEAVGTIKVVTHFGVSNCLQIKMIDIVQVEGYTKEEEYVATLSPAFFMRALQRGTLMYALTPRKEGPESIDILKSLGQLEELLRPKKKLVLVDAAVACSINVDAVSTLSDKAAVHTAFDEMLKHLAEGMVIVYEAGIVRKVSMATLGVLGVASALALTGVGILAIPAVPVLAAGSTLLTIGLTSGAVGGGSAITAMGLYLRNEELKKNHEELLAWLLDAVPFPDDLSAEEQKNYSSIMVERRSLPLQMALIQKLRIIHWDQRTAKDIIDDESCKLVQAFANVTAQCREDAIRLIKACQHLHEMQQMVRAGCFVGMMGAQDAGKTTLSRLLVGDASQQGIGIDVHTMIPQRYTYMKDVTLVDYPGIDTVDQEVVTVANRLAWLPGNFVYLQSFSGDPSSTLIDQLDQVSGFESPVLVCLNQASRYAMGPEANQQLSTAEGVQGFVNRFKETIEAKIPPMKGKVEVWVTDFLVHDERLAGLGIRGIEDMKAWLAQRLDFAQFRARQ